MRPGVWLSTAFASVREWMLRLWGTLRGPRSDRDLEQELRLHLELAEEELRRKGHRPQEAARMARVRFGGSTQALETMREQRGFLPLMARDLLRRPTGKG